MSRRPGDESSEDDDFDMEAFEVAFAEHFGETVEDPEDPEDDDVEAPGPEDADAAEADAAGSERSGSDSLGADAPGAPGADAQPGGEDRPDASGEPDADPQPEEGAASATVTAVVLTPLARAQALAKIMGLAGIAWPVVPTRTGAIAATAIPVRADDLAALTGELPDEIVDVAKALSHTSKYGVVLLSARVTHSEQEGSGGRVRADRYVAGEHTEELSPGLITTGADDLVEQLILGQVTPDDAPGALDPATEAARPTPGTEGNPTKRGPRWRRS